MKKKILPKSQLIKWVKFSSDTSAMLPILSFLHLPNHLLLPSQKQSTFQGDPIILSNKLSCIPSKGEL